MVEVARVRPFAKLTLLVFTLGAVFVLKARTPLGDYVTGESAVSALDAIRGSLFAPFVFVAAYATATALALPGSLLTIAGGAVFGFGWGSCLNSVGANLGANAAYALARLLGREGIERLAAGRLGGLDTAVERHGFLGLLILRLIPLVPFNALNFGSGLTSMRWRDYAAATVIGILPGTLVYTFFADALVQGSASAGRDARTRLWIAAGMFLLLTLVPLLARRLGFKLPSGRSSEA